MPRDEQPILVDADFKDLIDRAIAEDLGPGDVTCDTVLPAGLRFSGTMTARQPMTLAGLPIAIAIFERLAPSANLVSKQKDGDQLIAGDIILELEGPAAGLLIAERTALNTLQHLSGIATYTQKFVDEIKGTGATLLDTRKTIPGFRKLAKYATRLGGARNHRMGLYDGILIKDNHIAVCGGIKEAVARAKARNLENIEVECDTLDQVNEAIEAGADIILLDNMALDKLVAAVKYIDGRAISEASGGVSLSSIRAIAKTGVDFISVGALTQSAPAIDIGLDWRT